MQYADMIAYVNIVTLQQHILAAENGFPDLPHFARSWGPKVPTIPNIHVTPVIALQRGTILDVELVTKSCFSGMNSTVWRSLLSQSCSSYDYTVQNFHQETKQSIYSPVLVCLVLLSYEYLLRPIRDCIILHKEISQSTSLP